MNHLLGILSETWFLFFEMAPYLLLGLLFVGLLNMFVSKQMIAKYLGKDNYASVIKGAAFGIPLPLCSCGVIPTAIFMKDNNASKGAIGSFLISTPQTGIDSIIATYGMMGPLFAVYRPVAALFMGIFGGGILKYALPQNKRKFIGLNVLESPEANNNESTYQKLFHYPFREFLDDIAPQFLVGLILGGIITYAIPDSFIEGSVYSTGIIAMLIMIVAGVPMYICATASIPIAVALMAKGFSPGAAFVFLAVGPATNVASFSILSKSLGKKFTTLYVLSISVSAILMGLLLDFIASYYSLDFTQFLSVGHNHNHESIPFWNYILVAIFSALIIISLYNIYLKKYFVKKEEKLINPDAQIINIQGMTCSHCENTVKSSLEKSGIEVFSVSHLRGTAQIKKQNNLESVLKTIQEAGYDTKGN